MTIVQCEFCKKYFNKFPKEIKKTKRNFCSKTCSDMFQKKTNKIILLENYAEIVINSPKYGLLKIKIDLEDVEKIKDYSWQIRKSCSLLYVQAKIKNKIRTTIPLHRLIMNCPKGLVVDHINHDTLDNRKCNLRICTVAENNQNQKINKNNKTGFRGLSYDKKYNKYYAQISVSRKHYSKRFNNIEDAKEWLINKRRELMPFSTN